MTEHVDQGVARVATRLEDAEPRVATRLEDAEPRAGGSAGDHGDPPQADGRRRRRQRNREATVDALLDLFAEGNLRPSTDAVAGRAGLSPRSLFRYFDDVEDLTRAAIDRQLTRAATLLPLDAPTGASFEARIRALVAHRFRLFGAVGQAATVSRLRAPFQPVLAAQMAQNRELLRAQVRDLFTPELATMAADRAEAAVAAADVMSSFESYQLLQDDQGLSAAVARAVMTGALSAILGAGDGELVADDAGEDGRDGANEGGRDGAGEDSRDRDAARP